MRRGLLCGVVAWAACEEGASSKPDGEQARDAADGQPYCGLDNVLRLYS